MHRPPNMKMYEGAIFQVDPRCKNFTKGLFLIVTEVNDWGVQGYVLSPFLLEEENIRFKGRIYVREAWRDVEPCGRPHWEFIERGLPQTMMRTNE